MLLDMVASVGQKNVIYVTLMLDMYQLNKCVTLG